MVSVGPLPLLVLGCRQVGGVPGKDIGEHRHALVEITLRPMLGLLPLPLLVTLTEPAQLGGGPAQRERVGEFGAWRDHHHHVVGRCPG